MQKKEKILFILKDRNISYGKISYGLTNSANFVANTLIKLGIEAKVVCVIDNNSIDKEVSTYKPTHVIIEAYWVVPEKMEILLALHPNVFWTVRSHSKVPFFSQEGMFIEWTKKYDELTYKYKNFSVSSNNLDFINQVTRTLKITVDYLPNIYAPKDIEYEIKVKNQNTIDIGLFCSIRPLKNMLIQAMAAIVFADLVGKKLRLYINAGRTEQGGESTLKNIRGLFKDSRHELIELDWLNHDDFVKLVRKMDLGLQVSFSESFNIIAADFAFNDIPIVGSPEIEWMSFLFKARPTDFDDILSKMYVAYYGRWLGIHDFNKIGLLNHNKKATKEWLSWIKIKR